MRPYKGGVGMDGLVTKTQLNEVRKYLQDSVHTMMDCLESMPRELLLVLRNQNLLRSLNHQLGHPVNRFRLMAHTAVRGIRYRNWDRMESNEEDAVFLRHEQQQGSLMGPRQQRRFILSPLRLISVVQQLLDSLWFEAHLMWSDLQLYASKRFMRWTGKGQLLLQAALNDPQLKDESLLFDG